VVAEASMLHAYVDRKKWRRLSVSDRECGLRASDIIGEFHEENWAPSSFMSFVLGVK